MTEVTVTVAILTVVILTVLILTVVTVTVVTKGSRKKTAAATQLNREQILSHLN